MLRVIRMEFKQRGLDVGLFIATRLVCDLSGKYDGVRPFLIELRMPILKKILLGGLLLISSQAAWAEGERVYQYRRDGSREWSANYYERKGDEWIPYRPDGQRDWKANTIKLESEDAVQYRPDGQRDWNAPVQQLKPR